jgi:hypothetical protein
VYYGGLQPGTIQHVDLDLVRHLLGGQLTSVFTPSLTTFVLGPVLPKGLFLAHMLGGSSVLCGGALDRI